MTALTGNGRQLFLADLILKKRAKPTGRVAAHATPHRVIQPTRYPVTHRQLVLFAWPRELSAGIVRGLEVPDAALAAVLLQAIADHGDRHGWSHSQREMTWRGIRVLLALQDTPGASVTVSEANVLLEVDHTAIRPVLEILASVGLLDDDRQPALQAWFDNHTAGLPDSIHHELSVWFHALRDGSATPPRMRPRKIDSVRNLVTAVLPVVKRWADDGYQSLREITRDHVIYALPTTTQRRRLVLSALRGLFRCLKANRLVFVNPTSRLRGDPRPPLQMRLIELDRVRDALNSDDTARAAITALIAFHALRNGQVRRLVLTDIRDGRVHVDGNPIVLADPVRYRLDAWLAERARRWPNTANPHVFVSIRSAVRTTEVTSNWLNAKVGVTPETIRQDRILHEALATGGDARRLCDLFGVSIPTAQRYADVFHRPDEHAITGAASL